MGENFRSCQQIQNYSNILCAETRNLYTPIDDLNSVILVATKQYNWIEAILPYLSFNQSCALLRHRKIDAENCAIELSRNNMKFTYIPQTPIDDITTDAAWIYNSIAKYFILPKYTAYDFRDEIPNEVIGNKHILTYIKKSLADLEAYKEQGNQELFLGKIETIANYLGYDTRPLHCQKLYETVCDEKYHAAFHIDELKHISMTVHKAKGLEFEQVILFVSDYKLSKDEEIYNHYVAATRAKNRLIMVYICDDPNAKKYANNINRILRESHLKMKDIATVVNCTN